MSIDHQLFVMNGKITTVQDRLDVMSELIHENARLRERIEDMTGLCWSWKEYSNDLEGYRDPISTSIALDRLRTALQAVPLVP